MVRRGVKFYPSRETIIFFPSTLLLSSSKGSSKGAALSKIEGGATTLDEARERELAAVDDTRTAVRAKAARGKFQERDIVA